MGIFLLLLTLILEFGGIVLSYWYGVALSSLLFSYTVNPHAAGLFFLAVNLLVHVGAVGKNVLRLLQRRLRLGSTSEWQEQTVASVYDQVRSAHQRFSRRLRTPRQFSYSPDPNLMIGWVGLRLVIHDSLVKSRFLPAFLLHELAHYNSTDVWCRFLLRLLPPPGGGLGIFAGIGAGIGPLLIAPAWVWYWRRREFAADAFVAQLGHGQEFIDALEQVTLPRERERTLLLREIPYSEERIGRLRQALRLLTP